MQLQQRCVDRCFRRRRQVQRCRQLGPSSAQQLNVRPLAAAVSALPKPTERVEVVGLGNLCLDAVVPMETLPAAGDVEGRRRLLDRLTASPPDPSSWELGGNYNFMVAAARLGMNVAPVGHIGDDVYGKFMDQVLKQEGIRPTTCIAPDSLVSGSSNGSNGSIQVNAPVVNATLICFVLVDPHSRHAFCSRYDFGPWPLLQGIGGLRPEATQVLRASRAIFTNGFIFDELPLEVVQAACLDAIKHGSAIFFDPGPRCQTMLEGPRRAALDMLLDLSSVVLMTEEEALVVTGHSDPEAAARAVLARPGCLAEWCVVKMGGQGALLCRRVGSAEREGQAEAAGGSGSGSSGIEQEGVAAAAVARSSGDGIWLPHGAGGGNGDGLGAKEEEALAVHTTRIGALKVEVVDTVGCGDSFAAAVVMGFSRGWAPEVTLALACAVGAATATGRGAGRNVASTDKVLALLHQGATSGPVEQRSAFSTARTLLLQELALAGHQPAGQQASAAA